jgi:zinc protease
MPRPLRERGRRAMLLAGLWLVAGCTSHALTAAQPTQSPGAARVAQLHFPPLQIHIPRVGREVERRVLPNGIVVYLAEDRSLPTLDATALFRAGSLYEPADRRGLAQLTASQLRNGGTTRTAYEQLNEELEVLGASIEASASLEAISVSMGALAKDADRALELLAEVIRQPAFAPQPFETASGRLIEDLRRVKDNPPRLMAREFSRALYTEAHPLGRPLTADEVSRITPADLHGYAQRLLQPANMMLAVVGDFDRAWMWAKLTTLFGGWTGDPVHLPAIPAVLPRAAHGVTLVPRPLAQASLAVGNLGIDRSNPDRYAVDLMDLILGGSGFSSRIMDRVRTDEGLAYSAGTSFPTTWPVTGPFWATAQTKNENVARALTVILEEMERIRREPVTPEELARAKQAIENSYVFRFSSRYATVVLLMRLEFDGEPADYYETLLDRYRAVTAADIQRVAMAYLHPDAATIVVVGDAAKLEAQLAPFGPVDRVSPDRPE